MTSRVLDLFQQYAHRTMLFAQDAIGMVDPGDTYTRMTAASHMLEHAGRTLDQAVFDARNAGQSWQAIADATGMKSKQAAQQRWGHFWRTENPNPSTRPAAVRARRAESVFDRAARMTAERDRT